MIRGASNDATQAILPALIVASALLANWPRPVIADAVMAANEARIHLCRGRANRQPLALNAALNAIALKLSRGDSLHGALIASSYRATQATELHLTGATTDAAMSSLLVSRYCSTLTADNVADLGVARRGNELWMVVAAPLKPPQPREALQISQQVLQLVNQARQVGRRCGGRIFAAVASLRLDSILYKVALAHSEEMALHSDLSHQGRNGSTPAQRARAAGYRTHGVVGENIAGGPTTAADVVSGWLASPGHCENIMDRRFVEMGLAYALNPTSQSVVYWTQLLAVPRP